MACHDESVVNIVIRIVIIMLSLFFQQQQLRQQQQQQQQLWLSAARQWTRVDRAAPVSGRAALRDTSKSCCLCRTNGEMRSVYESHSLKDERGLVTCPVLYGYVCPHCGATGSLAHTVRYCPVAPAGASVVKTIKSKSTRDSAGRRVR